MAYAFDLKLVCGGYAYYSTFTAGAIGKTENDEVRYPSGIDIGRFEKALGKLGQRVQRVDSAESYERWLCLQGWAISETSFARESMPQWLKRHSCIRSPLGSFTDITIASPAILKRSFRGEQKRLIHLRDGNACLLCDAKENLTLQHVWPYSFRGETSSRNLVTLCEKCNGELKNEIRTDLYQLAGLPSGLEPSLLKESNYNHDAFITAGYLSNNLMHSRCDVW